MGLILLIDKQQGSSIGRQASCLSMTFRATMP